MSILWGLNNSNTEKLVTAGVIFVKKPTERTSDQDMGLGRCQPLGHIQPMEPSVPPRIQPSLHCTLLTFSLFVFQSNTMMSLSHMKLTAMRSCWEKSSVFGKNLETCMKAKHSGIALISSKTFKKGVSNFTRQILTISMKTKAKHSSCFLILSEN